MTTEKDEKMKNKMKKSVFFPLICTLLALMSVLSACTVTLGGHDPVTTTTTVLSQITSTSTSTTASCEDVLTTPKTDQTEPTVPGDDPQVPPESGTTSTGTTENGKPETPPSEPSLMEKGSRGDDVKQLQKALIEHGWLDDKADGAFGSKTEKAVSVFQKYNSLPVTGYVYQSMLDLLYSENAPKAPVTYDHEDVESPDRKTDYYIIVYNQNCRVLVLGKDDFGKYNVVVKSFICSVGIGGEDDSTPAGVFEISKRYEWRTLFGTEPGTYVYGQYTVRFNGNILFHSVPYKKQNKEALKMEEFAKLGTPASQGCVRLCVRDAKWIYDNCINDTQVKVMDGKDGPVQYEAVPPVIDLPEYVGWDPTDPDANSPYNKSTEQ